MSTHTWTSFIYVIFFIGAVTPQADILCPFADIAFVVDASESIGQANFNRIKSFLGDFVNAPSLDLGTHAVDMAVITYSRTPSVDILLSDYFTKNQMLSAIDDLQYIGGQTDLTSAIEELGNTVFSAVNGDRPSAPNIGIVITDGKSNLRADQLQAAVNVVKAKGVRLIAVNIANTTDPEVSRELQIIASTPSDIIRITDLTMLLTLLDGVITPVCGPEQIERVCASQSDIALVFDTSSSITFADAENWLRMIAFARGIVEAFPVGSNGTRFAFVMFSDDATVEFLLNRFNDGDALLSELNSKYFRGGETNIADALKKTRTIVFNPMNGDRPGVPNFIILVTDGQANVEPFETQNEANLTRQAGVKIFTIGITEDIDIVELNGIASDPDSTHVYAVADFQALERIRGAVINALCVTTTTSTTTTTTTTTTPSTTTTLSTTSSTTTTSTSTTTPSTTTTVTTPSTTTTVTTPSTTTTVTTPSTTTTVTTPSTTSTPSSPSTPSTTPYSGSSSTTRKPIDKCDSHVDVVFVLDRSGSIELRNFDTIKRFLVELVDELDVEGGLVRIGVLVFSDNATVEFPLGTHSNRGAVINAINAITYPGGRTNTGEAMMMLRTVMFNATYNSAAPDVALIITDGESGDQNYTLREAMLAKDAGIHMITLGIGLWLNEFELRGMASYPDRENDIRVSSFGALNQTVKKLRDIICDNNNECELPENACANGGVCQNGISLGYCICPAAYAGLQCQYECASAADVIFLIDGSGSVGKSNYEFLLNFVKNVTLRLDIDSSTSETQGVRVGLVTFSYSYKREFNLNEHMGRLSLLNAIDVPYIGGTTNTAAVLSYTCSGRDMFDTTRGGRAGVRKNIVLFTDGKSNNMTATKEAAKLCHDRGFFVLIVGLTYSTDRTELDTMATYPPDKNVYFFTNFDEMRAQQDNLADLLAGQICNNNDPCASNKCANGATCVALLNDYQCRCTEGWYGFYCNETCREELDLAFALDVSGSTRRERWSLVQDFVINVMRTFNFDGLDRTRVAVVYWDDNAHVAFHFNTHTNIQGLIQGIRDIPFSGGRTHTAAALQLLRTSVFTPGNGDRLTVRNFVIVITDGESNINSNLTLLEATRVRETGAKVMVVPVGGNFANMGEINAIASLPLDRMVHMVERFSELPNILPDIAQAACNDVDECLSNPCQAPGECRDDFQSYYCECPIGRSGQTCQRECNIENTDIVLLLDTSGSTEDDFREMSEFAYDLVYGLDMSADRTRVGVILFNTDSQMLFKLNTYSQKISVLNALRFKYTGGRTSIYSALRLAGADMFTVASGDRPGVRNILVLASDGYSTVNGGDPSTEAQELRNQGIEIYVVAMGSNPNLAELNAISSDPDTSHVINLADSDGMSAAEALLDVLCE